MELQQSGTGLGPQLRQLQEPPCRFMTGPSRAEVVAIWDVVSVYILGQMKMNKGVLVPGLGTFAVVHEQVDGAEEVNVVRRPVFQLDMDLSCLRDLMFPTMIIPGDVEIAPLDYWLLSQTTSLPPDVLRDCVEETVLLYSFQLRDGQHLGFAFGDIGILSCQDSVLCMRFHRTCVERLESWNTWVALLLTRLYMQDAGLNDGVTTAQGMQGVRAHSFPSMLPLSPGSFPGMGETGGQESAPSARLNTTLLASEDCQRALQFSTIRQVTLRTTTSEPGLVDRNRELSSPPVIQEEAVIDLLCHLNAHKSMGPQGIYLGVMRELVEVFTKLLSIIYQQPWLTREVPADWKLDNVTPIHKKGQKEVLGPVSLTSVPSKVMEQIILITWHLQDNQIRRSQHRFRKGRSCLTNLISFYDQKKSLKKYFGVLSCVDKTEKAMDEHFVP
ncbi:hypothetical protein BTVI_37324 [Pitangus sulphuratus]|nr:hypothetical protein BTVI_37324 [Pitangus sulphuratus]